MDIDSTLLTLISVTVLLPGGPLRPLHPHQLLQPAGQAVDGHAGSTQLCTLSASKISVAHSFIPAISALAQPSSWLLCSELLTNSPACSSHLLDGVVPVVPHLTLYLLSNPLPLCPSLPGGTPAALWPLPHSPGAAVSIFLNCETAAFFTNLLSNLSFLHSCHPCSPSTHRDTCREWEHLTLSQGLLRPPSPA